MNPVCTEYCFMPRQTIKHLHKSRCASDFNVSWFIGSKSEKFLSFKFLHVCCCCCCCCLLVFAPSFVSLRVQLFWAEGSHLLSVSHIHPLTETMGCQNADCNRVGKAFYLSFSGAAPSQRGRYVLSARCLGIHLFSCQTITLTLFFLFIWPFFQQVQS